MRYNGDYILGQARSGRRNLCVFHPDNEIDRRIKGLCKIYLSKTPEPEVREFGAVLAEQAFELEIRNKEVTWSWLKKAAIEELKLRDVIVDGAKYLALLADFELTILRDETDETDREDSVSIESIIHHERADNDMGTATTAPTWQSLKDTMND